MKQKKKALNSAGVKYMLTLILAQKPQKFKKNKGERKMTPKVIMDLENYQLMDEMLKYKDRLINKLHACYQFEDFNDEKAKIRVSKSAIQNLIIVMNELDIYEGKIEWIWEEDKDAH